MKLIRDVITGLICMAIFFLLLIAFAGCAIIPMETTITTKVKETGETERIERFDRSGKPIF